MAISQLSENKILDAIITKHLIRIFYSKKKPPNRTTTERIVRIVEPYEIKDGYLYAWDTTKDKTIKTFILDNINNVLVLGTTFEDRYPDGGQAFPTYTSVNPPDARRMRPTVNTTAFVQKGF